MINFEREIYNYYREDIKNNIDLTRKFIDGLIEQANAQSVLRIIGHSYEEEDGGIFGAQDNWDNYNFSDDYSIGEKLYDLILADFPIGLVRKETLARNANWDLIAETCNSLNKDGFGVFLIEPTGFSGKKGSKIRTELRNKGIFVNCYVECPGAVLPQTTLRPLICICSRTEKNFSLAELRNGYEIPIICDELLSKNVTRRVTKSFCLDEFVSFGNMRILESYKSFETGFHNYEKLTVREISNSASFGKSGECFDEIENSIYINIRGKIVENNCKGITNGRPWIQISLKDNILNDYLVYFFTTGIGNLLLGTCTTGNQMEFLDLKKLKKLEVPVPDYEVQRKISDIFMNLEKIEKSVEKFRNELQIIPESNSINEKLLNVLSITDSISNDEMIKADISKGESRSREFKSTFQLCLRTKQKQAYVEDSALKTLVAFMNTDGGTLYIGVDDSGQLLGVNNELNVFHKNSTDKYLLNLKNKIAARIGVSAFTYISTELYDIDRMKILVITCIPSRTEMFLDEKDFYIRTSPSSDKLEGRMFAEYVKHRFSGNLT